MKILISLCLVSCIFTNLYSQSAEAGSKILTGNLLIDSKNIFIENKVDSLIKLNKEANKKSPLLAGIVSAIIPGSGEFYIQNYWKAALFLLVEAAAITANIIYNRKGNEATREFQYFADAHWNAVRYAEWLNKYSQELGITSSQIIIEEVEKHNYYALNEAERQVKLTDNNGKLITFSHVLPFYKSQQYYELIGKYHQFNHGWDDSDPNSIEWINNLSSRFTQYAAMHIKPDETFYKYASISVGVIIVNHFLSAIDAIISTNKYNKNLFANLELKKIDYINYVEFYPQINLNIGL